jgi:hypothetical protein
MKTPFQISPQWVVLLILPPVYAVWLFSFHFIFNKTPLLKWLYLFLVSVFTLLFSTLFIHWLSFSVNIPLFANPALLYTATLSINLILGILLSYQSLSYEKSTYNSPIKLGQFFKRLFLILNWYIGFWCWYTLLEVYSKEK